MTVGREEKAAKTLTEADGSTRSRGIVCDRVSRIFRATGREETVALVDVSLSVSPRELVCLLGPSGCGKTTLLNLIAGFFAPTSGTISVDGEIVDRPGSDRGMVFQEYSLFGWLTVFQNVEFGLRMARVATKDRRPLVSHYLDLVGLKSVGAKYPFELSGGMKQRVAIARALVTNPKVLLMDEPFAALDALTRSSLQAQVLSIQETEAKTIVFVTHNIGEAIYLADRIIVMSSLPGRVQEEVVVDLPRPRSRTTPAFNELYERLENAIGLETTE